MVIEQIWGQIAMEAGVTIGVLGHDIVVEIHHSIHIRPLKFKNDLLPFPI